APRPMAMQAPAQITTATTQVQAKNSPSGKAGRGDLELKSVSDLVDRLYLVVPVQLLAQALDVQVHRPRIAHIFAAPDALVYRLAEERYVPVLHKKQQQLELLRGQRDGLRPLRDGVGARV